MDFLVISDPSTILNPFQDQVTSCVLPEEADGCTCNVFFNGISYEIADIASARAYVCLMQKNSGINLNFHVIPK